MVVTRFASVEKGTGIDTVYNSLSEGSHMYTPMEGDVGFSILSQDRWAF